MSRLEVRELSVEFGTRRVVDRVSFSLDQGQRLALVGESGSGKTVTALSLMRLLETARLSGEVTASGNKNAALPLLAAWRYFAGGFQFWMSVMGPALSSSTVLIRKRPSRVTSYCQP